MSFFKNELFKDKTFFPLFLVQFIGAFTDNALKSAFSFLVAFKGLDLLGFPADFALMLGAIMYILPFVLFSGVAGDISDRHDKAEIIQKTRLAEIVLATLAGISLYAGSGFFMLVCMFLYSTQSAFFGPAKYSTLPQVLKKEQLVSANALFESSTFVAILGGLLTGGFLAGNDLTPALVVLLLIASISSYIISKMLPSIPSFNKEEAAPLAPVATSVTAVKEVLKNIRLTRSAIGIAWFWAIGLVVISIFPIVAKEDLGLSANAANGLIGAFVIGIGLGTALISKMLDGEISAKHVPFGVLGMAIFLADLCFSIKAYPEGLTDQSLGALLTTWHGSHIIIDMIAIAAFGGVFTVPLYAIFQANTKEETRSRAIAGSNILNSFIMIALAVSASIIMALNISFAGLLFILAIINVGISIYLFRMMPADALKAAIAAILRLLFSARVKNLSAYGNPNEPAVVVANHTSYLDAILMGCLLPGRPAFAVNTNIAKAWWVRPAFWFFDLIPVDPTSPLSVRKMVKVVRDERRRLIIFPEGRLTVTGALMKIYAGPAMIASKADAPLIPIRIEGAQFSKLSYMGKKLPTKWFPKITVTVLEKQELDLPEHLTMRGKRAAAAASLHSVMTRMVFDTSPIDTTLFTSLISAKKTYGKMKVLEDIERTPIGYKRVITGAFALGNVMADYSQTNDNIGLLLPNSNACVVAFFGCHAYNRVPAMLNFTAGKAGIQAALTAASIKTVFTSRRFVEKGKLEALVEAIEEQATVVYLEDLRGKITGTGKVKALLQATFPSIALRLSGGAATRADDPAVILFTSGSEGLPKGVVLSHRNIQANRYQVTAMIDFSTSDTVLNALPMFHSFGLTAGTLLPLLSGVKSFLYPSPLHYRIVPEIAYDSNATIMFGTDTFLSGYARMAHAYDFYSLRYVFAGAERVRPETRKTWNEKFGLRVLEGYGTTETAPVLSINTPMANLPGSVGKLMPGMTAKLEDVPGVDEGGRLHVCGPNVMKGYLKVDLPNIIQPPEGGWHDTGDIVTIDDAGYITIKGRAKRFAKIGGEMVSLAAVEALVGECWPEMIVAAVALPHDKKGEQVVLLTEEKDVNMKKLATFAKAQGVADIMIPKTAISVDTIPMLGTGKVDLAGVNKLGKELFEKSQSKS